MDVRAGLRLAAAAMGAVALTLSLPSMTPGARAADEPSAGANSPQPLEAGRDGIKIAEDQPRKPEAYDLGAREAIRIASEDPKVAETRKRHGRLEAHAEAKPPSTWQVGYFRDGRELAQVLVDEPSGTVRESWTGYQVAWQMARGYSGQFGHLLNAPYVWIPLCAIFFFGLLDFRRPWRIVHLDLLVLLAFGASHVFFNAGEIGISVPLVYPVLVYLLARVLWMGFRGVRDGLRPSVPIFWLAIVATFLIGFRIALNVADSGVIDVGYAGVIGADRIMDGEPIYGEDAFPENNPFGDTYGPVNYYLYVPFEQAISWSGEWDALPAAHGASLLFDLAAIAGLYLLGRRMRPGREGRALGVMLTFAWAAYPYTAYALQSNANDSLVGALVVLALVAISSPLGRGALTAVAALTKFAPLALAPLLAAGPRAGLLSRDPRTRQGPFSRSRLRALGLFALALVGVGTLAMVQTALDPGLATFWDRTVDNQMNRDSPFSVWGQEPALEPVRTGLLVASSGFALLVAFVPRQRSLPQLAALAAAVLLAIELTAQHWFYLYIVWFFPPLIAALAAGRPREIESSGPVPHVGEVKAPIPA